MPSLTETDLDVLVDFIQDECIFSKHVKYREECDLEILWSQRILRHKYWEVEFPIFDGTFMSDHLEDYMHEFFPRDGSKKDMQEFTTNFVKNREKIAGVILKNLTEDAHV